LYSVSGVWSFLFSGKANGQVIGRTRLRSTGGADVWFAGPQTASFSGCVTLPWHSTPRHRSYSSSPWRI
jgi:hypothetical protein